MNRFPFLFAALTCGALLAQAQQSPSWTSHDKLSLTYFFYWYDAATNKNLTLHPPDSYLSTYSYDNIAFYQRELSDMAAAGIDVVLPVYWGDPGNAARWSVPGLHFMAQVEQAVAQAGQTVPKIGMFFDTSTSLTVANGGTAPDLTTAAGKTLFYSFIHTFFANVPRQYWAMIDGRPIVVLYGGGSAFIKAYDQSTFDYVAEQFRQDFGTTPYVIRHFSWLGVTTDAEYAGWPTSFHATFAGDVGSVAPGEDNYSAIAVEKKIVTDRNCGDLYQADWDQVVAHGARLVFIEDWNELFEGSGISATKEYGRRYIDQTARNVARWKSSANPPPYSPPATVWASMGPMFYSSGIFTPFNYGGAAWLTTQIAGHDAMYPDHSWPSYYIYLAADERFLPTRPASVWVTVEYLDSGSTPWRLEYDGVKDPYWATPTVASQNSGQWKLATFNLPDALFEFREGADLRIDDSASVGAQGHYFNRVWITKSAPTGQPPQMPLVPDVSVPAGSTMDISINATDSSGKPLAVSLATVPGFATLQGNAGAQKIHLAPTAADFRTCSDVTGPGVTSTPNYHISAVANDPNSMLGNGATSFSVLVTPPVPVIQQITDSWNYTNGVAPGAWVTIWGTGLAVGSAQTLARQ
jgi:hypothetical protein